GAEPSLDMPLGDVVQTEQPDINSILRRVAAEPQIPTGSTEDAAKADFIAAARRAALSSNDRVKEDDTPRAATQARRKMSIGSILSRHRKHAMMVVGGAILIMGGIHYGTPVADVVSSDLTQLSTLAEA